MSILEKSRELVYVLLRAAVYIRRPDLRRRIEHWSFELLENTALEKFEQSLKVIKALETLVSFGQLIYEIEPINASIIIKELSTLESAIRQIAGLEKLPDLGVLFSKKPLIASQPVDNLEDISYENQEILEKNIENIGDNEAKSVIRQSAILDKIRQFPDNNCQLRDLIAEFPDVSERTLRYDLQKLLIHGLIARVGGGAATSYVIK